LRGIMKPSSAMTASSFNSYMPDGHSSGATPP
jgi:hypothetical protein